ncbi:MAG: hemerythrin domain-containing protein [Deltaproteobacteria bacterium]|jgi:hemerythrin-like domain-containing protein|nr:hemerythrin domain-containing protein [Deltaproteobacteria bacterium]MDA8307658.1 hemerythrin domain-containing protein [Deltaproteobacteria bacterium]
MNATDQLRAEHEGILTMLQILERICEQMNSGKRANLDHLDQIVEFLQVFADKCHHGKEEDILFPALEKVGIPREGGPIGVMLSDHEQGRKYIRAMGEALEELKEGRDGSGEFVRAASGYIELLRSHIMKENNVLFVMGERNLSQEEQTRLFDSFEIMEQEKIGVGRHEAFHRLIDELSSEYLSG